MTTAAVLKWFDSAWSRREEKRRFLNQSTFVTNPSVIWRVYGSKRKSQTNYENFYSTAYNVIVFTSRFVSDQTNLSAKSEKAGPKVRGIRRRKTIIASRTHESVMVTNHLRLLHVSVVRRRRYENTKPCFLRTSGVRSVFITRSRKNQTQSTRDGRRVDVLL